MHVLMISLDASVLTSAIGDNRKRHEAYATMIDGQISMAICNRRSGLDGFRQERLAAQPTESGGYAGYLRDGYRVAMAFHRERPVDVIAAQDPFLTALIGLAVRQRTGAKLIIQDHASMFSSRYYAAESWRNRIAAITGRLTVRFADAVRVLNRRERLKLVKLGLKSERICIIPTATSTREFSAPVPDSALSAWREKLGLGPDTPALLWAGRPTPQKNLPNLFDAFGLLRRELPAARLILVGDVSKTNFVGQAAARGLGDAVVFTGPLPHSELPALFQMADVFVLSSDYEGTPRVLIEAGAAGLPMVSTDVAGAPDLILDNVSGRIVPIRNPGALAEATAALLRDPARRADYAARARQHILKTFNEADLYRRWVGMWGQVAKGEAPCVS